MDELQRLQSSLVALVKRTRLHDYSDINHQKAVDRCILVEQFPVVSSNIRQIAALQKGHRKI